jgi:hypothetical protein
MPMDAYGGEKSTVKKVIDYIVHSDFRPALQRNAKNSTIHRKRRPDMRETVYGTIYFMDKTKLMLRWPRQAGSDPVEIAVTVRKALESDRIMAEVEGRLLIIPVRNIKYIEVSPAPQKLPKGVLLGAEIMG